MASSSSKGKGKGKERMIEVAPSNFFQTVATNAPAAAAETQKRKEMFMSFSARGSGSGYNHELLERPPLHLAASIGNFLPSTSNTRTSTQSSKRARVADSAGTPVTAMTTINSYCNTYTSDGTDQQLKKARKSPDNTPKPTTVQSVLKALRNGFYFGDGHLDRPEQPKLLPNRVNTTAHFQILKDTIQKERNLGRISEPIGFLPKYCARVPLFINEKKTKPRLIHNHSSKGDAALNSHIKDIHAKVSYDNLHYLAGHL
ncbi:hypothetical protein BDR26DRAFT_1006527 [Obelidium mucronatum]|nr:hypothetical protein BDR26DRAFT_1006527 [Obelidium mucronatum]